MLHSQAAIQKKQIIEAQNQFDRQFAKNQNRSILENVNAKSDEILIDKLSSEFQNIKSVSQINNSDVFLLEVLEQLHLISFKNSFSRSVLENSKNNILVCQPAQDHNNIDI